MHDTEGLSRPLAPTRDTIGSQDEAQSNPGNQRGGREGVKKGCAWKHTANVTPPIVLSEAHILFTPRLGSLTVATIASRA